MQKSKKTQANYDGYSCLGTQTGPDPQTLWAKTRHEQQHNYPTMALPDILSPLDFSRLRGDLGQIGGAWVKSEELSGIQWASVGIRMATDRSFQWEFLGPGDFWQFLILAWFGVIRGLKRHSRKLPP